MTRLIFVLIFLPFVAHSEPNPAIRYLMNEPATLFDLGMHQLHLSLREDRDRISEIYRNNSGSDPMEFVVGARYDDSTSQINISIAIFDTTAESRPMSNGCRAAMEEIGGRSSVGAVRRALPVYFSHEGFVDDNAPDDFYEMLEQSVKLKCVVMNMASEVRFRASMTMGADDFRVE